jgi:hypothetical protein
LTARHSLKPEVAPDFPGGPDRHRIFPSLAALVIFLLAGVVAPLFVGYLHISHSPEFSEIDEINHYDYVTRIAAGGFPRLGQDIQPSSIRELQCRGLDLSGSTFPSCHAPFTAVDRKTYGATITQYEAQQPPGYYAITVPLRWAAIDVFGFNDLTGTRSTGLVWLIAGLFCLWAACRILGVPPAWIGAGLLLIATAPVVMDSATIVSNDAAGVLAGSLVLLVGVMAWRRPWRWMPLVLFAVSFVVTTWKTVDVLPVLAAAVLFGILEIARDGMGPWGSHRDGFRRWLTTGGALAAGGLISAIGWVVTSRALSTINPKSLPTWQVLRGSPNGFSDVLREAVTQLSPLSNTFGTFYPAGTAGTIHSARWYNVALVMAELITVLVMAGALSGLFASLRRWPQWMGLVSVVTLYGGGIALGYSIHYLYNVDPGLSGRYGLPMVPLLILTLVAAARDKWVVGGIWILGAISLVATTGVILG